METDPYSAVRDVLNKFPSDENAKDVMEQRDIAIERMHADVIGVVEQLNKIKPFFKGQIDDNAAEKERLMGALQSLEKAIHSRILHLKEKETELEHLQQLNEMRRSIVGEQRMQSELLKAEAVADEKGWLRTVVNCE